ncbi:HRDC domain-containing protein [Staphylococcus chromogenes]|nr:HRDC domain-containing protein [Staphylococcus chromogenes]
MSAPQSLTPLLRPRAGIPAVGHTPADFAAAAVHITKGRGPIAIDTERASEFRFDDRAFLVQLRRQDSGTLVLAPESDRAEFTRHLAPVLNTAEWIVHAAMSDLPALTALGLRPRLLFDTEMAGRLAGFSHVNLAALVAEILGYQLEKGHADEYWAAWPLPEEWINYAALDVELLLELAEALTEILAEQGKLAWAEQEFAYILSQDYSIAHTPWQDVKGVGKLKHPRQRQVARALWEHREALGREHDIAPNRILSNRGLVEIATLETHSQSAIMSVLSRTRSRRHLHVPIPRAALPSAKQWVSVIRAALATPEAHWPAPVRNTFDGPAPRSVWSRSFPEAATALNQVRLLIDDLAQGINTPAENILQPSHLRELVWQATITGSLRSTEALTNHALRIGVREWQLELTLPLLTKVLV